MPRVGGSSASLVTIPPPRAKRKRAPTPRVDAPFYFSLRPSVAVPGLGKLAVDGANVPVTRRLLGREAGGHREAVEQRPVGHRIRGLGGGLNLRFADAVGGG